VPDVTWLPTETRSSRTRALNGAGITVSIFMLARTATSLPAHLLAGRDRQGDHQGGAGARSTRSSSRHTRCVSRPPRRRAPGRSGDSSGEAGSSMIFCLRRWMEQSRTWTCRAPVTK
jgi:hypothetical protein